MFFGVPLLAFGNQLPSAKTIVFFHLFFFFFILREENLKKEKYSRGSNTEHWKTKSIRKPNVLKFGFKW